MLAKRQATTDPENTIFGFKRLIGRRFDDHITKKLMTMVPYKIVKAPNKDDAWIEARGRSYSPSEITAFVLRKMKEAAEAHLGTSVQSAIITVPSHFDESQRKTIIDAGSLAGLEVKRVPDQIAAVCACTDGLPESAEQNFVVYDLGSGTFNISIVVLLLSLLLLLLSFRRVKKKKKKEERIERETRDEREERE